MIGYEALMERMLAAIPDDIDKREGSLIYVALAPVVSMITEQQWYADNIMDTTMADTALGGDLTRKCGEHGVNRYPSSPAVRQGVFTTEDGLRQDVALGSRFGAEGVAYAVTARKGLGVFELTCEETGKIGNIYFGPILPIDNPYLGTAALSDVLVPGEETESDEELRARFYIVVNSRPFGGNIAQYEENILAIPGVGGVKVFPTPESQGGKVRCVIVDADFRPASPTLVAKVQETINPEPSAKGFGVAPIGHDTTISTTVQKKVHVAAAIAVMDGYALDTLLPAVRQAVEAYLSKLVFRDNVIRIARLDAEILAVPGISDISGTALNGEPSNLILEARWDCYETPALGDLTVTEAV